MAVNPLSLAESLRPWRVAGVSHFLGGSASVWHGTSFGLLCAPGQDHKSPATLPKAASSLSDEKLRRYPGPGAVPADWPERWQALFARTKPAPILWTYPELGIDLGGQGCAQRSACLRELIGKLQLPRGSSTFWPLCLDAEHSDAQAQTQGQVGIFKGGMLLLAPKVVVLIGPRTASLAGLAELGLDLHTPFTQQIVRGMLFVLLPQFPAMLENTSLADRACVFLRSALARISI